MKKEGREGPKGKISLLLPLVAGTEQGEGRMAPALIPALRGTAAAGDWGKREREGGRFSDENKMFVTKATHKLS